MEKSTFFNSEVGVFFKKNIETISFGLMLCSVLFPLFCVDYLVTGDGPCHFYNSNILNNWHFKNQASFYKPFYQLNYHLEPNWITNAIQLPLINIFSVIWAEKIFFLLYFLTFSFGFRRLIVAINPNSVFLSSVGLLFAWSHILMLGFTNNSWSFALWFWVVAIWIESLHKDSQEKNALLLLFFLLIYFAHPMGMMLSFISIACITFFWGIFISKKALDIFQFYKTQFLRIILVAGPAIILFLHFFLRKEWSVEAKKVLSGNDVLGIFKLIALINVSSKERDLVCGIAIFILLLFIFALTLRILNRKIELKDGLFLLSICILYITFNPPSSFSGGLEIGVRLGVLPYIAMIFWIAVTNFANWVKISVPFVALFFSICLAAVRVPVLINASEYASEIVSVKDQIQDQSKLLVLNYDWIGRTLDNKEIANRIWLFNHVDCYLGAYKPLVISDNYEVNFWYFPVIERWETNMYKKTSVEGMTFDNRPPRANFLNYPKEAGGQKIDYVLMLSYRDEFSQHPYTKEIFTQLDSAYTQVFKSNNARAILYKLK